MSHIFISYSRQDQAYVTLLAQALESHRLPLWLDDRIDYGTTWPRVIQDQLEQCAVFLLVMSPRSENSHWVQCELSMALELKKPVFPLLLEGDRWLAVAALQQVNVVEGKLPPANFFERLRPYFPGLRQEEAEAERQQRQAEAERKRQVEAEAKRQREEAERQQQAEAERQRLAAVNQRKQVTTPTSPAQSVQDDLSSERFGANYYAKLRDLLAAQDWEAADKETADRMFKVMNRQSERWLGAQDIEKFPCLDLRNIDRLWVKYSNGKFGFSVQKEIWQSCGSPTGNDKNWEKFGAAVGWRTKGVLGIGGYWIDYSQLTFDLRRDPKGHLPYSVVPGGSAGVWFFVFLSRQDL